MKLHLTGKILSGEVLLFGVIHLTLTPFILLIMQFPPEVMLQYLAVTPVVLYPLTIAISSFFITPWVCRPITMLDGYLEHQASPPDDRVQEARIRVLNLPVIHTVSHFIRYECATLPACPYLGVTGVLSLPDNILPAIHGTIGMPFIPLFAFLSVRASSFQRPPGDRGADPRRRLR
jgi:hypothetical protein